MKDYWKFLVQMTKDILCDSHRVLSLAVFEYKLATKGMFFGQAWKLLNPLVQIGVYWLVFGIGLRNGRDVDGIPFVVWLTCGLTPWLIMNRGVVGTANSIYSKTAMLTRANIPTYLVPLSSVAAVMMDSIWDMAILMIIYIGNGCVPTWNAMGLIYYILCVLALSSVCSLILSVLVMLARDFVRVIQALMRILYFLSPVFWQPGDSMPAAFWVFDACNPFAYVIRGFRDCLLYDTPFWANGRGMLIFWSMVGVLYLLGAAFQSRLRKNLLDFL